MKIDHSTMGYFLVRFCKEIVGLFTQVVKICQEQGRLDFDLLAVDSLKLRANANPRALEMRLLLDTDLVAGVTATGPTWEDAYVVRTDGQGALRWSVTFGRDYPDRVLCVDRAGDNGFVLAGTTRSCVRGNSDTAE